MPFRFAFQRLHPPTLPFTLMLVVLGCSGPDDGGGTTGTPSCLGDNAACGTPCGNFAPCPSGLFCGSGNTCEIQCTATNLSACGAGAACTTEGRCSGGSGSSSGGVASSGGTSGSGGISSGGGVTSSGGVGSGGDDGCGSKHVIANRVTPNVILIVDQSGSMTTDFQGGSRWNVLRSSLLQQPGGLIAELQGQISFGLAMYSGLSDDPTAACPVMTSVAPMLNNYQNISNAYQGAEPLDDTPTGDAIDFVIDDLGLDEIPPDAIVDPTVFVLATDGEPDRCEELDPQNGQDEAIAAVTRAYDLHVPTYLISVGSDISATHQQAMANAGAGVDPGDADAPYWVAGDDASLRTALTDIISQQLSCDIALEGKVTTADACRGTVLLSGAPVPCNDPNGWQLIDPSHIQLMGTACDRLMSDTSVQLDVSFPCDVDILQ